MRIDQIWTPDGTVSSDRVAVPEIAQLVTCEASLGNGMMDELGYGFRRQAVKLPLDEKTTVISK